VNSLGINSGLYRDELKEKWIEDESEGDVDEEEMEQVGSEENVSEVRKHVNGDIGLTRPETFQNDEDEGCDTSIDIARKSHTTQADSNDDIDDNEADDFADDNDYKPENISDDYRNENVLNEESNDDDDDKEEEEEDIGSDKENSKEKPLTESRDPFTVHFDHDLDESVEKSLGNLSTWQQKTRKIPSFGSITEITPSAEDLPTVDINVEDGFTVEFYNFLFELLGHNLVESFNEAYETNELSISQRRGIITLIPKEDGSL